MHREDEPGSERRPITGPAPGDRRQRDAGPRMPEQIRGMEPRDPPYQPIERVRGDREGAIHAAAELRGPVGSPERAPPGARPAEKRIPQHDREVVEGETVP